MIELRGHNFIGNELSAEGKEVFKGVNPVTNENLPIEFHEATSNEINNAIKKAEQAFMIYTKKSGKEKALFLETIAEEIISLGDDLLERCNKETGLPLARLIGERGRTVNQLRMFAELLKEGSWVEARIETAIPGRLPLPKPDIRSMYIALGPVGIFGASNFPLAFSVAGGDTTSALAAGCTVIFKAHPAHPGTCELITQAIIKAVKKTNMPDGTFSMVHGRSTDVGMAIVNHPLIKAIGFTGSFKGGKAIYDAAVTRPEPIPVYAEMGSANPVFILPGALKERKEEIAKGLAASVTLGVGQFCTNPGLVFLEESKETEEFQKSVIESFANADAGTMLTSGIQSAYQNGIKNLTGKQGVNLLAEGKTSNTFGEGRAYLFQTNADNFSNNEKLEEEIFGPSTLTITANNKEELLKAAHKLHGHLTITLHATEKDLKDYKNLISILERKAGRLIINGFPTGVEVCHSMVHGGPFPATTDSRTTSVGTLAINRFVRLVSYQNFPDELLPDELKNNNPLSVWRIVDGERKK